MIGFFSQACLTASARNLQTRLVAWADYTPDVLARWATDHCLVGVSLEGFILSPELTLVLRAAGLTISVGAVNNLGQLERLLPQGPDIIVSDRPHEIREAMHQLISSDGRSRGS